MVVMAVVVVVLNKACALAKKKFLSWSADVTNANKRCFAIYKAAGNRTLPERCEVPALHSERPSPFPPALLPCAVLCVAHLRMRLRLRYPDSWTWSSGMQRPGGSTPLCCRVSSKRRGRGCLICSDSSSTHRYLCLPESMNGQKCKAARTSRSTRAHVHLAVHQRCFASPPLAISRAERAVGEGGVPANRRHRWDQGGGRGDAQYWG